MNEHFRNNYFTAARTLLLLMMVIYTALSIRTMTGASIWVLLLLASFTGTMSLKELISRKVAPFFLAAASVLFIVIYILCGKEALLLGILTGYEIVHFIRPDMVWYFLPAVLTLFDADSSFSGDLLVALLLCVIYVQHDHVAEVYRDRTKEDTIHEQSLKHELRAEMQRTLLSAENSVLEERAQLSQTLHDKLGHNINGSVYQLEAVKLLMEKDPERARSMVQAVIDQLRTGMDEIRAILRDKRPEKHLLAAAQLHKLCEDCRTKGIDAELITNGDLSGVPESHLEVILDNCVEAVSNSLKYSGCTKIEINIHVMNKVIRCSITDNGKGCSHITDGMGISGMRRRIRQLNGILEITSESGFMVNMLLPL